MEVDLAGKVLFVEKKDLLLCYPSALIVTIQHPVSYSASVQNYSKVKSRKVGLPEKTAGV